jgi:cyclopropane-fatty-acyl-phospholipid synthase
MSFEQGWISLHPMLAIKPDGHKTTGSMPGAQSAYPFVRDFIYK